MDGGRWKGGVRESGAASAESGGYANTGIHIGDVYREPVARSAYLEQVEQIFPWTLEGRSAELAELAAFCSGEGGPGYVWWQGPAWAGKSALMATLVLHPPAGVRVVSFFITARYAGQSDRQAFLDVVLPQLAELLGQSLPPLLGASTQQGWFNRLLKEAARACAGAGERLVLVVDGLDEDRGVTVGPGAHSIAALLPPVVAEGLRVVVAGRPNPPVPSDVPVGHPLRDARIVRALTPSAAAQVIRDDAERELEHVLHGDTAGRDLLGLLVAAGGGLSIGDLAELTGAPVGGVRKWLHAVSGRTFTGLESQWRPGTGARVFVLAHEELHTAAVESLGAQMLSGCHDRIHAWAQGYRDRGWPAETPEYLLRGYHRLLGSVGDLDRMVACATDRARLDRMLDISGGDVAALAEITTVQQFICHQDHPDLTAMLKVAVTRDRLIRRNSNIPPHLPAAWAYLGNPNRAEALARSIADPSEQVKALSYLVEAFANTGDLSRIRHIAATAETSALSISHPTERAKALGLLVEALVDAKDLDQAMRIAHSITDHSAQAGVLGLLVAALVDAEDLDQAMSIARSVTERSGQVLVLSYLAGALAKVGDLDRARETAATAETIAYSITSSTTSSAAQPWALIQVARAWVWIEDLDRAREIASAVEDITNSVEPPYWQVRTLCQLLNLVVQLGEQEGVRRIAATAQNITRSMLDLSNRIEEPHSFQTETLSILVGSLAHARDLDKAETIARSITDPTSQAEVLSILVGSLAHARDLDKAETIARSITDPTSQAKALSHLVGALIQAGDLNRARQIAATAETIARSITDPTSQAKALSHLVGALIQAGDLNRARQIAATAETIARSITDPTSQAKALSHLVKALAEVGDLNRAETIAHSITDPSSQAAALSYLVAALTQAGELDEAETIARSITDPNCQAQALSRFVMTLIQIGDIDRVRQVADAAEAAAHSISDPAGRVWALNSLTEVLAQLGDLNLIRQIAVATEAAARSIDFPYGVAWVWSSVVRAAAQAGDFDWAESTARSIFSPRAQAKALGHLVEALTRTGNTDRAEEITRSLAIVPSIQAKALSHLVEAFVQSEDLDQAEAVVRSISEPSIQAEALTIIFGRSDLDNSRRILAAVLANTQPIALLKAVAMVAPEAVIYNADYVSQP
ncbi:hypothetical protein [Rhizohabitans arisaemae]|uniref:hypothetical protein n=2 Tax=Rhizohabitans arisaemae TaxID=2720610 RepID=UPI0024B1D227|nr:hypothetical protein [Rhizohabitans arisaemae]